MASDLGGLLLLDKPEGMSSHTAVRMAARLVGEERAGHAGTLDPLASGLLLVGIGRATRLLEFLVGCTKTYRAVIRLGMTTDTLDREGEVLSEAGTGSLTAGDIESALSGFRGRISQIPPVYSAIKVEGVPLYRRARRGEKVAPPPREVEITRLDLTGWENPYLTVEVDCSSGTYIRSLARDIGESLGTGGVLWALRRLKCGPFGVEEALTLDEIADKMGETAEIIRDPVDMVYSLPKVRVGEEEITRLRNGREISVENPPESSPAALIGPDGNLLAIASVEGKTLSPGKVFL